MSVAGGTPTQGGFLTGANLCDIKEGFGALSSSSIYPGIAPQYLEANASVDWGEIKTFAQMDVQNWENQGLVFPRAIGQAGYLDDITFNAPGMTGQAGTAVGTVHLTGLLQSFGYQGNAAYSFAVMVGNSYPAVTRQQIIGGGQGNSNFQTVLIDEYVNVALNFIYGTPFAVGVFGWSAGWNSSEGGYNYLPGQALSDFEHTMQWTGLSSVSTSNYSVTSASGDDWILGAAAPTVTPEPATVVLMATGLLVLAGFTRRREPPSSS